MAKRRTPSTTALLRVGWRPDLLPVAEPSGKGGEMIKVINWGANNLQPQDVVRLVYDSGTGEACYDRLFQFIGGKGFANKVTADTQVNPEQTMNDLLAEAKHYVALQLGFGLIIRYSFGGQPAEYYVAETECLRREKDGQGRYVLNYSLTDGKMPTAENRVYLPFDPLATPQEIGAQVLAAYTSDAGYWGHMVFTFERKVSRRHYPVPSWYAGKEDLETDAAVSRYDRKQSKNGFFPDAVMTVVGKKYDSEPDEEWTPAEGQSESNRPWLESPELEDVKKTIKALKGSETESSVMLLTAESQDELPQIDFIDKGPNSKGLTDMTNRVVGKVCRHMGVPPVLIGVAEAGMLGNNQQIVNSIKLFNMVVNSARSQITDTLQKFFPTLDFSVIPLDPVDYIDPAIIAKMTPNEIRALRGLPPLASNLTPEQEETVTTLQSMPDELRAAVLATLSKEELRAFLPMLPAAATKPRPKA